MRGERLAGFSGVVVFELVGCCLRRAGCRRLAGRNPGLMPGLAAVITALQAWPNQPLVCEA